MQVTEAKLVQRVHTPLAHCKSMPAKPNTAHLETVKQTSAVSGLSSGSASGEHDESSNSARPFSLNCDVIIEDVLVDFESPPNRVSVKDSPIAKVWSEPKPSPMNKQASLNPFARSGTSMTQASNSSKIDFIVG